MLSKITRREFIKYSGGVALALSASVLLPSTTLFAKRGKVKAKYKETEHLISINGVPKIKEIRVFDHFYGLGGRDIQICIPNKPLHTKMEELRKLKSKYGLKRILGFNHPSTSLWIHKSLLNKQIVTDFAQILCV